MILTGFLEMIRPQGKRKSLETGKDSLEGKYGKVYQVRKMMIKKKL